jgi:hypothetical protein
LQTKTKIKYESFDKFIPFIIRINIDTKYPCFVTSINQARIFDGVEFGVLGLCSKCVKCESTTVGRDKYKTGYKFIKGQQTDIFIDV